MPRELAVRAALWVHLAGAAGFLWLQPRGFSVGSRGFWEHQVVVPLFFLLSLFAAACPAGWPRSRACALGALAGFWMTVSAAAGTAGSTVYARGMWAFFAAAFGVAALVLRTSGIRAPLAGVGGGALIATAFLICAWAPPASTRPLTPRPIEQGPRPDRTLPRLKISVQDRWVIIDRGAERLAIDPGFRFDAVSLGGFWTVFDYSSLNLPLWEWDGGGGTISLIARTEALQAGGLVWIEADGVHIQMATTLARDVASHLSSVMTARAPGDAKVEGVEWPSGDPACFVAFRHGSLALLRASRREKGPFDTLATWSSRDPVIDLGAWRVQVRGWAEQASKAESPTAGWGVSQGAIENSGGTLSWSLASTSIGRGWHTVRTAAGTYSLEIVIRPRL